MEEIEVPWFKIRKGYEITKNDYVVIEKEDIDKIKLKTNNTVEVKEVFEADEFDPIFVEKNYYVGPDPGKKKIEASTKAYSLLVKILDETKKDSNRQSSTKRKRASGCFKSISKRSYNASAEILRRNKTNG